MPLFFQPGEVLGKYFLTQAVLSQAIPVQTIPSLQAANQDFLSCFFSHDAGEYLGQNHGLAQRHSGTMPEKPGIENL